MSKTTSLLNKNIEQFEIVLPKDDSDKEQTRKTLIEFARVAENAERWEDMSRFMRQLVEFVTGILKEDLSQEERNLLSVAYKNVIGSRRASWRCLSMKDKESGSLCNLPFRGLTDDEAQQLESLVDSYRKHVEEELNIICSCILSLLEQHLIPTANEIGAKEESKVFYLKMAADYYRYRAESATDEKDKKKAGDYYKQAFEIAKLTMNPTNPIRLGLALNYSVCWYEILKDKRKACDLAKTAFDLAISKLDKLEEPDYKDATLIMQLLKDNLTLWTSSDDDMTVEEADA